MTRARINADFDIDDIGLELVGKAAWTSATSSASFSIDRTKHEQFLLRWWVDHNSSWATTGLRFRNSSGDITTTHYASTSNWQPCTQDAGYVLNASPWGGTGKTHIWLAGNGNDYDSHGEAIISIPNTGVNYPSVRSKATLIYRATDTTYQEESGGTYYNAFGNTITGVTIFGTGGSSRRGVVTLYGVRK